MMTICDHEVNWEPWPNWRRRRARVDLEGGGAHAVLFVARTMSPRGARVGSRFVSDPSVFTLGLARAFRAPGLRPGLRAFAGIFIALPAQLFNQILLEDVPYRTGWTLIAVITLRYAVLGAVGGAVDKPAKA
jgi:hypothetical protein